MLKITYVLCVFCLMVIKTESFRIPKEKFAVRKLVTWKEDSMARKGENIYKRKDGRWEGRYIKGRTESGKAVYGYIYAENYYNAREKLAYMKFSQQTLQSRRNQKTSISLRQVSYEWLERQKAMIKLSSYTKYDNLIRSYIEPELGNVRIAELTEAQIEQFSIRLLTAAGRHGKGLAPKTVSDTISVLRQILRYADEHQYSPGAFAKKMIIRRSECKLRVLSIQEQSLLGEYLLAHMNLRNMGILLSLYTGLRIGELCALKWDDISLSEKTIYISRTMQRVQNQQPDGARTQILIAPPKSSSSIRKIPLTDEIADYLSHFRAKGYFLTGREDCFVEPRTMQYYFKRVLLECKIAPANFHALRHTFATRCVELGFDTKSLSEILGHASVNITMNRYVHPSMDLKRQNMQRLSQIITVK